MPSSLTQPLVFEPLFFERPWGGRRLETSFHRKLPPGKRIGESWEIVDRPEAQSVVRQGPLRGKTLHELWVESRPEIFGAGLPDAPRFPILVKLLDACAELSLQVHPPAAVAESLGAEPKTEFWYFAECTSEAQIFAGLRAGIKRGDFEQALFNFQVADSVHRLPVKTGDSFFVPSGRIHGLGAGNLVIEIQQNSDTTYRVYDWDRRDAAGKERELHLEQALQSIRFDDCEPQPVRPQGEELLACAHFVIENWKLTGKRAALDRDSFAIFACLTGELEASGVHFQPGDFWLTPATAKDAVLRPISPGSRVLRVTLPVR